MNLDSAKALAVRGELYPSVILHGGDAEQRRTAVLALAKTLLCQSAVGARPCSKCRHCTRIEWPGESGAFHPDFLVLERDLKTVTSVEAVKAFLRTAQVAPFEARGQVFVISNAETLSGEAANALLKNLEEPHATSPRNFFLLAPSQAELLPTLRSRSLAVFLGNSPRWRGEQLHDLVARFGAAAESLCAGGGSVELLTAAAVLGEVGDWKDARAAEPWERAATVVLEASRRAELDTATRRRLLDLAAALMEATEIRVRGIPAPRILEGLTHRHLR